MVDFTLSESQRQLREGARAYAQKVLTGAHAVYSKKPNQKERFRSIRSFYRIATAAGQIKGQILVPLGGTCESLLDAAIILEELYATDPSVTLTVAATGLGLTPLIMSGNEKLQKKYLAPFLKDEGEPLASLVHSEPSGTANWLEKGAKGLQTTATKEGTAWIINGEKVRPLCYAEAFRNSLHMPSSRHMADMIQVWTTNSGGWDGKGADLQCVVCRQSEGEFADPSHAIIILLVTRDIIAQNDSSAYEILDEPDLMGHPATTGPHSKWTNFRVPEENVLATGETAATLVEQSFTASAALVGALSVSVMRAAFTAALEFAKKDTRGGTVPIVQRQSVADLLIDIKIRMDSSRLLTWKALHTLENGPGDFKARQELCLEAKIFASDSCVRCVTDAMSAVGM